jgi:hypothetical protein
MKPSFLGVSAGGGGAAVSPAVVVAHDKALDHVKRNGFSNDFTTMREK